MIIHILLTLVIHSMSTNLKLTLSFFLPSFSDVKMSTLLPGMHSPCSFATLSMRLISLSLYCLANDGILYPLIPLDKLTCLTTVLDVEHARIGWKGLYLAMNFAILPVSVRHMKMSTLLSRAMLQAVVASMSTAETFYS